MTAIQIAPQNSAVTNFLNKPLALKISVGVTVLLLSTAAFPFTNAQKAHPAELPQTSLNGAHTTVELDTSVVK